MNKGQATAFIIFIIVVIIAVVGLLLTLGAVKTGQIAWQAPATTSPCLPGWIQAWAHSTNHSEMLKAGYGCTQSIVKGMVCCAH